MNARISVLLLFVVVILSSCSVIKKKDADAEIRTFLSRFQQSLRGPENELLSLIESKQSRESIQTILAILQNRSHEFIICDASFNTAEIKKTPEGINVVVPVVFTSRNLERKYSQTTTITLFIKAGKQNYAISKIEGEEFYSAFAKIKNEMEWMVDQKLEVQKRELIFAKARQLQQTYDSVIWYSLVKDQLYFYVTNGAWENQFRNYGRRQEFNGNMGLAGADGALIIPVQYDLIGTIGFDIPNIVEVKKDGKAGYFDLSKRNFIVPVEYDLIIPYGKQDVFCFVKTDSIFGWYNDKFEYTSGFPSAALETWVTRFEFLPKHLQLDASHQHLCEIPAEPYVGYGIVMPPSYLSATGIFYDIVAGLSLTAFPMNGWTDYVETEGTFFSTVTGSISALVTTIKERYLDGREEFYRHNKIVFVGQHYDTLAVRHIGGAGAVTVNRKGDLIEVINQGMEAPYFEESFWPDVLPVYTYFQITDDGSVLPLNSKRNFTQTEFIRLDSSYFVGSFKHFRVREIDGVQHYGYDEITFVSQETITFMRDEMLAAYGMKFKDEELNGWFYAFKDIPEKGRSEIELMLTDIDHHNLLFLESLLKKEVLL